MREERDMEKIKIKYLSDKIERLRYIDGKSDWIDLRAAERVELKKGEFQLIPLGVAMQQPMFSPAAPPSAITAFSCPIPWA